MCSCPLQREQSHGRGHHSQFFTQSRNQLLAACRPLTHLKPVAMALLKEMEQPNQRIETVYFMETDISSVVAVQPDGPTGSQIGLEVGRARVFGAGTPGSRRRTFGLGSRCPNG
jgi:hypothetical protein